VNGNEVQGLFHSDELDPFVHSALTGMLMQSPDDSELRLAMERLRRVSPSREHAKRTGAEIRRRRRVIAVSASVMLCVLWCGAQTETWGTVAADYQRSVAPRLADLNVPAWNYQPTDAIESPGSLLRFVLVLHVFGLLSGIAGLSAVWASVMWRWSTRMWSRTGVGRAPSRWHRKLHLVALVAYGLGMVFGCCWAELVWGAAWRWDPREAFALLTLGIGAIWYFSSCRMGGSFRLLTHEALVASLAFWLMILMYSLAGIYAARLHTHGFPSRAPTFIACLLVVNLSILAAGHVRTRLGFKS
jgi:hypothetical protein